MLIVANWKAYVGRIDDAKKLMQAGKKIMRSADHTVVLAPPAPFVGAFAIKNTSSISFAAQDVSASHGGALTGESTAQAYAASGASYAIIGHSERRAAGDTDEIVAQKLTQALAAGLTPILCVGEHERDRDGRYLTYVREEITSAFASLTQKERARIIIAYEPLWAIGKTAAEAIGPQDLAEMVLYIRKVLAELVSGKTSANMLVLYGGSVEPANIRDLARWARIDGFLIGHASVDESTFIELAKQLS